MGSYELSYLMAEEWKSFPNGLVLVIKISVYLLPKGKKYELGWAR